MNSRVNPFLLLLLSTAVSSIVPAAAAPEAGGSSTEPCSSFTSLFSFGDSVTDTGNQMLMGHCTHCCHPPYGATYFGGPTGRCSDGRLIVDFIAEKLELPSPTPFPGVEKSSNIFRSGANLAEGGATALDFRFLAERGIFNTHTNLSLGDEMNQFKELLPTLCSTPSECKKYLSKSLILMGETGAVDYHRAFFEDVAVNQITGIVPYVIDEIGKTIQELVELGAVTILVPGIYPLGCLPIYLGTFWSHKEDDYDPSTGCLVWYNDFFQHHNDLLRKEIVRLQTLYPDTNIMYVDYYNSAMRLYQHPKKFGFTAPSPLESCCGGGGPYNYNASLLCGNLGSTACADPSTYINWDEHHLTEAAYRIMANDVVVDLCSIPSFNTSRLVAQASSDGGRHYSA